VRLLSARPERFDVAVIGGGCAGIADALASAGSGAHTLLVERASYVAVHTTTVLKNAAPQTGDTQAS
jgi:glycerol-3-phosphate dehydrogenase